MIVLVNLCSFEILLKEQKPHSEMIESIDMSGPAVVVTKNCKDVLIVTRSK